MKKIKNLILIILIIAVVVGIGFLIFRAAKSINYNKNAKNPILTLEVEGYGEVKIELQPDYAPNTVATIVKLAQNGYYNGKVFYGTDSKAVTAGMKLKNESVSTEQENVSEEASGEVATTQTAEEDKIRVSDLDKSVTPYISETDEVRPAFCALSWKDRPGRRCLNGCRRRSAECLRHAFPEKRGWHWGHPILTCHKYPPAKCRQTDRYSRKS